MCHGYDDEDGAGAGAGAGVGAGAGAGVGAGAGAGVGAGVVVVGWCVFVVWLLFVFVVVFVVGFAVFFSVVSTSAVFVVLVRFELVVVMAWCFGFPGLATAVEATVPMPTRPTSERRRSNRVISLRPLFASRRS